MLRITRYCSAANGQAYLNGKPCLENPEPDLHCLLQSLVEKYQIFHPRFGKMDRLCQLGFTVSDMLLIGIELVKKYGPFNVGIVLNNSSSSLDTDIRYNKTIERIPSPALFIYTLPNIVIAEICIKNNIKGEHHFFVTETPDNKLLYSYIKQMFDSGRINACIGGWLDVLDENYRADLFLVEDLQSVDHPDFSIMNIDNLKKST